MCFFHFRFAGRDRVEGAFPVVLSSVGRVDFTFSNVPGLVVIGCETVKRDALYDAPAEAPTEE